MVRKLLCFWYPHSIYAVLPNEIAHKFNPKPTVMSCSTLLSSGVRPGPPACFWCPFQLRQTHISKSVSFSFSTHRCKLLHSLHRNSLNLLKTFDRLNCIPHKKRSPDSSFVTLLASPNIHLWFRRFMIIIMMSPLTRNRAPMMTQGTTTSEIDTGCD